MAFMSALSTFVAQNMGAGNKKRADQSLFMAQSISICFGAVMFALTFFAGGFLSSFFTNDPNVLAASTQYLYGSSLEYLMIPLTFCFWVILTDANIQILLWRKGSLLPF